MINQVIKIILVCLCLSACSESADTSGKASQEIVTVTQAALNNSLFYSGTILPLRTVVVTSPAEGVIEDMSFHYGDTVKASQFLFTIVSEKFKTDYKGSLMQYIKAKNEFNNARSQLTESKFLHKNQLISDDDFRSKQTAFYSAQLGLVQAQDALSAMLKQLSNKNINLYKLSIEEIDKITQALHIEDAGQKLRVRAPRAGVALLSIKSNSEEVKKIEKGDQVKQGDIIAVIGDLSGFVIRINVSEFNINQIKLGQHVKVTGAAFSDFVLQGQINGIDKQGQVNQGGMPVFPVEILVPKLTAQQQALIHVGMSAKVEININLGEKEITVPLDAIIEKKGKAYVMVQDPVSKKFSAVLVKTGLTTENSVVILSNLKAGDKVLVTH